MAGPWISESELKSKLADTMSTTVDELVSKWDGIITDAIDSAVEDIVGALTERGYTDAQINSWSRAKEFNRDIGIFWALTRGGGLANYTDQHIAKLDRRKELLTCSVRLGSKPVVPDGEDGGGVSVGRLSEVGSRITDDTQF